VYVLLVFAMMATATITLDLGSARLAQDEMQTAADAAAVGGLVTTSDAAAHASAQVLADATFYDPSGASQSASLWVHAVELGSGGQNNVGLHAGELIGRVQNGVDEEVDYNDPLGLTPAGPTNALGGTGPDVVQLNAPNANNGDIVSGSFAGPVDVIPNQLELDNYQRPYGDFTSGALASAPGQPALLVRLRRTQSVLNGQTNWPASAYANPNNSNPSLAPGLDQTTGVASSGPAIPFLFGHGALLSGGNDADPTIYTPLRDGIYVRATAIAALSTATAAGWPTAGTLGATSFAITDTYAQQLAAGTAAPAQLNTDFIYFQIVSADPEAIPALGAAIVSVAAPTVAPTGPGFIPIYYLDPTTNAFYVLAFVEANFTASATTLTVAPVPAIQTGANASAVYYDGLATNPVPQNVFAELFRDTQYTENAGNPAPVPPSLQGLPLLQAPALVR
jgi:hypothetical protein